MTLIGGVKHKDNILVYGDSKLSGNNKDAKPAIKINHYGNIIVASSGFLYYQQLWALYINSGEYLNSESLFNRIVEAKKKVKVYEWDKDIILSLFLAYYDWLKTKNRLYNDESDVLGANSFVIATENNLYSLVWGAIEETSSYCNRGSGCISANATYETVNYLNNRTEEELLEDYLKSLIKVVPEVDSSVDIPFHFCTPIKSKKKDFYTLEERVDYLTKIETEKDIEKYLKKKK